MKSWFKRNGLKTAALVVDGRCCITVKVARKILEKMRGLSDQKDWDGTPMVFPFSRRCRPAFWMHRVSFPLDIVWVADGKVVGVTRDVPQAKSRSLLYNIVFLKRYHPPRKIDMAIELRGGESRPLGIREGLPVALEG